ncbi:MAG TPA: NAD(P)/FAD-dependent oxidoreductase, partial [Pyrinomonadaceae bacterium]
DAALENALILSKVAKRVYLIHRRSEFSARPEFVTRVQSSRRIELVTDSVVTSIAGDSTIRSIDVKDKTNGANGELDIDALLIRVGVEPNTELVRGQVKLDPAGYVIVDSQCQTSQPNVFAVGDIANPLSPTLATSVGTGASAARSAVELLSH